MAIGSAAGLLFFALIGVAIAAGGEGPLFGPLLAVVFSGLALRAALASRVIIWPDRLVYRSFVRTHTIRFAELRAVGFVSLKPVLISGRRLVVHVVTSDGGLSMSEIFSYRRSREESAEGISNRVKMRIDAAWAGYAADQPIHPAREP